jgi:hypothetical protein
VTFADALALMVSTLSAANLERSGVTYEVLVGDEHLDRHGEPPRIVIVPLSSSPAPARQQTATVPRVLAGELHTMRAELWAKAPAEDTSVGRDYVAAATMKATFVRAMRDAFGTSFQMGTGQWSSTDGSSVDEDGRLFELEFSLSCVLVDVAPGTAVVQHALTNVGITEPGQTYTDPP